MNIAPEFRPTRASDEHAVCTALGLDAPSWSWAYGANPAGSNALAAFGANGALVAHYGGVGRRAIVGGKERRISEVAHPFEAAPGHLALSAKGYFDAFGGPRGDVVLYGWPEDRRLATKLLEFEVVRTEDVLVYDGRAHLATTDASVRVERLERFDEHARWLYDRCAGAFGASVIRDAEYLNWRFVDRPGHDYTILGARDDDGILRGYAVLARATNAGAVRVHAGEPWPGRALLVDWLVPADEPNVGDSLLSAAVAEARRDRAQGVDASLTASIPPWSPWFERFQRAGFRVCFDERALVARAFVRKYDDLWLRDNAWLTLSDWIAV